MKGASVMTRALRAVEPGETADVPKNMVEATERTRLEFLVRSRVTIAGVIDAGVPAHALARLIAETDRIDSEIRRLEAADDREGDLVADDESFDAEAI